MSINTQEYLFLIKKLCDFQQITLVRLSKYFTWTCERRIDLPFMASMSINTLFSINILVSIKVLE